jgi:hypothetical protein
MGHRRGNIAPAIDSVCDSASVRKGSRKPLLYGSLYGIIPIASKASGKSAMPANAYK